MKGFRVMQLKLQKSSSLFFGLGGVLVSLFCLFILPTLITPHAPLLSIGQSVTVGNLRVTLVSVRHMPADHFALPRPGSEFLAVHLRLTNVGYGSQEYNSFDFSILDTNGQTHSEVFVVPLSQPIKSRLLSGMLARGGVVEGAIVFQVPLHDHGAVLSWLPHIITSPADPSGI